MSGFFRNVSSSSESSSTESDDEPEPQKRVQVLKKKPFASAFLPSDSGGEEDVKRVVRSAKEKRYFLPIVAFSSTSIFIAATTS